MINFWDNSEGKQALNDMVRIYICNWGNEEKKYKKSQARIKKMDSETKKYVFIRCKSIMQRIDAYAKVLSIISICFALVTFIREEVNPYYYSISLVNKSRILVLSIGLLIGYCAIASAVKIIYEYIAISIKENQ